MFAFRNEATIVQFCNDGRRSQCKGVPAISFNHGEAIAYADDSTSSHLVQLQHPARRSYSLLFLVPFDKDGLGKTEALLTPTTLELPVSHGKKFKSVRLEVPTFRIDLDRRIDLTLKRIGLKDMVLPNSTTLRQENLPY